MAPLLYATLTGYPGALYVCSGARKVIVPYADERREERQVAGVVTIRVGTRSADGDCIVGPPGSKPLLGQVVLEQLDLLVDCVSQKLVPRPESPFLPLLKLK